MFFNFSRVGLSPTQFILDAGDVARIEALHCDDAALMMTRRYNGCDDAALIASRPSDRDPRGAILSILSRIPSELIWTVHRDRTATNFSKRSTMDRFIVTVNHFNRMVTPKCNIKLSVLPMF